MTTHPLVEGLRRLPDRDKRLLTGFVAVAILALALGLIYGTVTALGRAGFVEIEAATGYRMLTLHGVTIFFYRLYSIQAGFVLVIAACYAGASRGIAAPWLAWLGLLLMVTGFVLNQWAPMAGAVLLYDAQPELVGDAATAGGVFYLGYVLLAAGLFLVAASAIATAIRPKLEGRIETWSAISFASVAWAGLLMVSAMAAINAFLPPAAWIFGLATEPHMYTMSWHVLFHNVHYLPLMAAVLLWYVLIDVVAGVRSVFGARFSKIVFASYLLFIPPTSLYHMFLEPGLSEAIKVIGSLLSLFIAVPTVLVFLIIMASLESHARARGARGLFGWIGHLPWGNPAMAAIGMAVVNTALGGTFSFVLIQERLAPLLSDTFFIPGYFHFLTLGLLVFGAAGVAAGYLGVPRRVFDVSYGDLPAIWSTLMAWMGVGAVLMVVSLAVHVTALAATLLAGRRQEGAETANLTAVSWGGVAIGRSSAWVGPPCVVVLVGAMYVFTALGFELMQRLPVLAAGGGHGGH